MKISFTCNNIGTGGAERVVCNIANRMVKDGHTVDIICYERLASFYYKLEDGVRVVELDPRINKRHSFIARKFAGLCNLVRLFKAVKGSDRVISFYSKQNCYSILVCKLRKIPIICAERDHFFMYDGKINHWLRKTFYPHADGFIHQTNMARDFLRAHEGVKCEDVVIPNPLWINSFPERKPIAGNVIAVGRLAEQKNYSEMIEAFAKVIEKVEYAKLHIYGDGSLRESLEAKIDELKLNNKVVLHGMVKNVVDVYRTADVFVMFSHGEGYPNALMEALAMGVPCISSDCPVGGPRDMIEDGVNGYLVPCSDVSMLSERIVYLLENDELRKHFAQKSVEIKKTNDFEIIYNRYMDYILSV